jgi:P pilus assembly chaperone PapD
MTKMNMTTTTSLALLLTAMVLAVSRPAKAQLSMSLSPVRVEHAIPPGEIWTDIVTVENVSERPLRARVTIADWYLERNGTPVFVKRGTRPGLSMSQWIDVNPTEFEVAPGASYRTAVLVESLPDFAGKPDRNVAYLTARIGVIIYNRVGTEAPLAEVVGQEVISGPGMPNSTAVKLTVRNRGLVNFRLSGESQIVAPDGQVLQVVSIPDGVVLPQSEREVLLRFEEPISHRVFNVLSRVDIGQEELLEIETQVGVVAADDDDTQQ